MPGYIEVICGPMFGRKTTTLISRLKTAQKEGHKVMAFKHANDTRCTESALCTHDRLSWACGIANTAAELDRQLRPDTKMVGVDEVQFFDQDIVEYAERWAIAGRRVVLAGLDQDYRGEPFGPMPSLLLCADVVTKLSAVCVACGDPAIRTYRITKTPDVVLVGASETYEARCRVCHRRS